MWLQIKKYIKGLQRSSDTRKKRWLILATTITMIIVVSLWVVYLNVTLPPLKKVAAAPEEKGSFFTVLSRGFVVLSHDIREKLRVIQTYFGENIGFLKAQIQRVNEFSLEK